MKITNFRPLETETNSKFAYVDVEYPWWRFKAKQTKIVFKLEPEGSCFWRWLDTGEYAPDSCIGRQMLVYLAKKQLNSN